MVLYPYLSVQIQLPNPRWLLETMRHSRRPHVYSMDVSQTPPILLKIFDIISDIALQRVPLNPALAILSLGIDYFPPTLQHSIVHLLLATRLTITRHWKDKNPPTVAQAIDLTQLHYTYERMVASSSGRLQNTLKHWAPWISWYTNAELNSFA